QWHSASRSTSLTGPAPELPALLDELADVAHRANASNRPFVTAPRARRRAKLCQNQLLDLRPRGTAFLRKLDLEEPIPCPHGPHDRPLPGNRSGAHHLEQPALRIHDRSLDEVHHRRAANGRESRVRIANVERRLSDEQYGIAKRDRNSALFWLRRIAS